MGVLDRHPGIGTVVAGDELDLPPVDAAAIIDHVEIGGLGPADRRKRGQRPGIRHDIADADFSIRRAGILGLLGCDRGGREEHGGEEGQRTSGFSYCFHQRGLKRQANPGL